MRRGILVGFDFSAQSLRALEVAFGIACRREIPLIVCHVISPPAIGRDVIRAHIDPLMLSDRLGAMRRRCEEGNYPADVRVAYHVSIGEVSDVLSGLANTDDIQALVVGAGAGRDWEGSVVKALLKKCHAPLLTVSEDCCEISPQGASKSRFVSVARRYLGERLATVAGRYQTA